MAQGRAIYGAKEAPCMGKAVLAWNQARAASARPWLRGRDQMTGVAHLTARERQPGRRGQARGRLPQDRAYSSQASGAARPLGPPLARLGGSSGFPPQRASRPFPSLPAPGPPPRVTRGVSCRFTVSSEAALSIANSCWLAAPKQILSHRVARRESCGFQGAQESGVLAAKAV